MAMRLMQVAGAMFLVMVAVALAQEEINKKQLEDRLKDKQVAGLKVCGLTPNTIHVRTVNLNNNRKRAELNIDYRYNSVETYTARMWLSYSAGTYASTAGPTGKTFELMTKNENTCAPRKRYVQLPQYDSVLSNFSAAANEAILEVEAGVITAMFVKKANGQ